MSIITHDNIEQGTEEWLALRRGMVTASVVGQLITAKAPTGYGYPCPECDAEANAPCVSRARKDAAPIKTLHGTRVAPDDAPLTIEPVTNDYSRALTTTLVAERITGWTDPVYVSNDMLRGTMDEPVARAIYAANVEDEVVETGFMVRDDWGFEIGYSPDGLVGDDGLIEVKSRRQKKHLATILADEVPLENMAQIQAGLLVSGREWCDYISYCGGMPMWRKRVYPDADWHRAIVQAVEIFETSAEQMVATYRTSVKGLPETVRFDYFQEASV